MKRKTKVCILIDQFHVEKWIFDCINNIICSSHSEIILCVKNSSVDSKFKKTTILSRLIRVIKNRKNFFYYLYVKVDNYIFNKKDTFFKFRNLREIVNCDVIDVVPIQTKFSDRFEDESINEIKEYGIDVILRFGFRILRGDILTDCSKYGVWSFHHADYKVNRGGPAGFWEFLNNHPCTGITLQILNEELDNGIILYQTYSATNTNSLAANRNNYYPNSNEILLRMLTELYNYGGTGFFELVNKRNQSTLFYSQRLYTRPSNIKIIYKFLNKLIHKIIKRVINKLFVYQWIISYRINKFNNGISGTFYKFKNLTPPKDRFWADPFVIRKKSKYFIYFEELLFKQNKGHISCIELDERGNVSEPKIVLKKDYHLSYPFLIEEEDELYMIPETYDNDTIELYKCVNFPDKWKLDHILMNGVKAVDTTIFKNENKYWMFTNIQTNPNCSPNEELYLFFSDSLFGKWSSHPMNPIVSDVRCSRPAGKIIEHNGKIYRPSQNDSVRYGYSIKLNEITKLTEKEYDEINVEEIEPNWSRDLYGVHTINNVSNITVIDCLKRRRRFF